MEQKQDFGNGASGLPSKVTVICYCFQTSELEDDWWDSHTEQHSAPIATRQRGVTSPPEERDPEYREQMNRVPMLSTKKQQLGQLRR